VQPHEVMGTHQFHLFLRAVHPRIKPAVLAVYQDSFLHKHGLRRFTRS
jgi:hypothetical protein